MQSTKKKLYKLIESTNEYKELVNLIANEPSLEFNFFSQSKVEFLDIHEVYLKNNIQMNVVTNGLKETIDNIKGYSETEIVINLLQKENLHIGIYTNKDYTVLFGII